MANPVLLPIWLDEMKSNAIRNLLEIDDNITYDEAYTFIESIIKSHNHILRDFDANTVIQYIENS